MAALRGAKNFYYMLHDRVWGDFAEHASIHDHRAKFSWRGVDDPIFTGIRVGIDKVEDFFKFP